MVEAGLFRVFMGVESGSQRMLNLLNKQNTPEKYRKAFKILNKFDIITLAAFMIGLPGEEQEDIQQTIALAEDIQATEYYASNYVPYPGTQLYEVALQNGFIPPDNILGWSEYHNKHIRPPRMRSPVRHS